MKSNYKRLGNHIHKVEKRNKDSKVTKLRGLSMTKEFRETTSNIVGTDMSVYKVMSKWQFACDFMSVIRVHKFPVVLKTDDEPNLVSPAYPVFEVKNPKELNPEYLMMWFRRSEFDRYADFKCDSAIRGGFDWDALCDCMLPIPSPEKQLEIVKEYNTIQNRINLNNQLIIKLEETAQAIYKQWFVDFEFPDENGKAYKSNGGEMVFCEELEKEIPKGWEVGKLNDFVTIKNGKTRPTSVGSIPVYGGNGIIDYVENSNYENLNIIGRVGAYCGSVYFDEAKVWISDNALAGISKNNTLYFDYLTLMNLNLNSKSEGSSHPLLTQGILNNIDIIKSKNISIYQEFEKIVELLFKQLNNYRIQNKKLEDLNDLLLARMTNIESRIKNVEN